MLKTMITYAMICMIFIFSITIFPFVIRFFLDAETSILGTSDFLDAYSASTSVLGQVTPSELQQLRTDRFADIFRNCGDIFPLAVSAKELQPAGNKAFRRFHILMPESRDLCNTDVRGAMVAVLKQNPHRTLFLLPSIGQPANQ